MNRERRHSGTRPYEIWFYLSRLLVLTGVLGALIWASLVERFHHDPVVAWILIGSGFFVAYPIADNLRHLVTLYRSGLGKAHDWNLRH